MIDVGVARPSAHGQAMIRTDDRVEQREVEGRLRARASSQTTNVSAASPITAGTNYAGHGVGEALDRRPRALRLGHQADDLGEDRVAADARRADGQRAGRVDGRRR